MEFKCPNGHDNFQTFEQWRKHKECPICKSNKFYKMDDAAPKAKGYRILAFDQATHISGWSVYDEKELIKFGHHTTNGQDTIQKICQVRTWLANMIQSWNPDLVVFEDIQLQKFDGMEQVITYKTLAQLQGALFTYCYENGIIYKTVFPSKWRSFNEIKGKSRTDKKKNAQFKVKELFDINVTQDESEAILIGRWAAAQSKNNEIVVF